MRANLVSRWCGARRAKWPSTSWQKALAGVKKCTTTLSLRFMVSKNSCVSAMVAYSPWPCARSSCARRALCCMACSRFSRRRSSSSSSASSSLLMVSSSCWSCWSSVCSTFSPIKPATISACAADVDAMAR
ncbi:uncharacterized protein IUM83_13284 [Phytophthora cinnamomi]|uniref:uncharacterized protein n=1 Tax=Phytophthora cinnamomi TaxID=4785 RepID=UPI0035598E75|nr:hypothetical protein IUM83_13284 [Phytophthora cinnamomi]